MIVIAMAAAVVGASIAVGFIGSRLPHRDFDWELFAVVLTGLGTTALAVVTGSLAWTTSQDVRASQRAAVAAEQQLEIARREEARTPLLTLLNDDGLHSLAESNQEACVRLVVANEPDRRAARGTRVVVDRYWPIDDPTAIKTIGSPSLGWPSATDAVDGSVVIFAGSSRPVDFGILVQHLPGTALEPRTTTKRHRPVRGA